MIEDIKFKPVPRVDSLVGFCSFGYHGLAFHDVAVHRSNDDSNKLRFRLLYPAYAKDKFNFHPTNKETQELIDQEVSAYIFANFKEVVKNATH